MNNFDNTEEEYNISFDLKKELMIISKRSRLMLKVFTLIFVLMIIFACVQPKKYTVNADLYINKTNNSNMKEFNPYVIDEAGSISVNSISNSIIMNELEIVKSSLVMDKVIKDNNIRYQKLFGIFKTVKTGELISAEKFIGKGKMLKLENKKGTSIITISYTNKDRELAYNVVNSIIKYYIELHKEINSEKAKSDKKIIEEEYEKTKRNIDARIKQLKGLPANSMNSTSNLAAMSAFSASAKSAFSQLHGQYAAGEKSQLALKEEAERASYLASKLEWAKLVDEMSDSSKVLVIKEPRILKNYEQSSPKLFTSILLGIVSGIIGALIAAAYAENTDKKLSYSMLGNNIIYDLDKEFKKLSAYININNDKTFLFAYFDNLPEEITEKLKVFRHKNIMKADFSEAFTDALKKSDSIITFAQIGAAEASDYKLLKSMAKEAGREIVKEVLV